MDVMKEVVGGRITSTEVVEEWRWARTQEGTGFVTSATGIE